MGQENWKLVRRKNGYYSAREIGGQRRRVALGTNDPQVADLEMKRLYGAAQTPEESVVHLELGKAHLNLSNPHLTEYTFDQLFKYWHGQKQHEQSTRERRKDEVERGVFARIKDFKLCDPRAKAIIEASVPELGIYAREALGELQRLAFSLEWMTTPFVTPILIKISAKERRKTRAITREEHENFVAHERAAANRPNAKYGTERADYYQLLFLTGAAQTDGANLTADNVDWKKGELSFKRAKTKEQCRIAISGSLETLLKRLPKEGPLFPRLSKLDEQKRARDFRRHVKRLGLHQGEEKLTLHSYRYHMAEWCATVGMPMRFAQIMLGHASKTVATAYARHCKKAAPTPEAYMKAPVTDMIDGTRLVA